MAARPGSIANSPPRRRREAEVNPFVTMLRSIQPDIEGRLRVFLDANVQATRALGPEVLALSREVRRLALRGGKRLRPALVVAGFRTAKAGADLQPAVDAGVALELSLIHI